MFGKFRAGFERRFAQFHRGYVGLLHAVILHRFITLVVAGSIIACGPRR